MARVKIIGAGSIGNHLAHACRGRGWSVAVCDVDAEALRRMREEIYPDRFGSWDDAIRLAAVPELADEPFDLVIVGTPPDTHLPVALQELEGAAPRALLIEKPLCPPDLRGVDELLAAARRGGVFVGVGYNHSLTRNTELAERWLVEHPIGEVTTLVSMTREHWGGIFRAHPWLAGPWDSYLGYTSRGGGALGEHSHALHIWQHFARLLGCGRIREVSAMLDTVEEKGARYDRLAQLSVRTEHGLVGTIVQDVVTEPARKWLRIQGSEGYLEWEVNADPGHDAIRGAVRGGAAEERVVPKTRPDDFAPEIAHLAAILAEPGGELAARSPISLERGLETMLVIAAAIRSSDEGRQVRIDWDAGFGPEALD